MKKILIIDRCYDCRHYTADPDKCWYKKGKVEIMIEDPSKIAALCPLPDAQNKKGQARITTAEQRRRR